MVMCIICTLHETLLECLNEGEMGEVCSTHGEMRNRELICKT